MYIPQAEGQSKERAAVSIRIESTKKEPDASGEGYGDTPQARATSDSAISISDLPSLVKETAVKPQRGWKKKSTEDSNELILCDSR